MITLGEAPSGPEFIASLTRAMRMFALDSAGKSDDDEIHSKLESYIKKIEPSIREALGAAPASLCLEAFRGGVLGHRLAIIKAAASGSLTEFIDVLKL